MTEEEKHLGIHTHSNGGMSDCFMVERDTQWVGGEPVRRDHTRLLVGTNKKRGRISFQTLRFSKDLTKEFKEPFDCSFTAEYNKGLEKRGFKFVGEGDMDRYDGMSFSPKMMKEFIITLQTMMPKNVDSSDSIQGLHGENTL